MKVTGYTTEGGKIFEHVNKERREIDPLTRVLEYFEKINKLEAELANTNESISIMDKACGRALHRIKELEAELALKDKVVQVLAEWLHTERSSTFRPPTNQPDVKGIIEQATAKAKE